MRLPDVRELSAPGNLVVSVNDPRGRMADMARKHGRRALAFALTPEKPHVLPADGRGLPLPAGCAHLVIVFEEGDAPRGVFEEALRILRPGGRIVAVFRKEAA